MKILITGTSGSGKSAVGGELQKRGFDVVDTDQDVFNNLSIAYWANKITGKGVDMPWPPPKNWHNENDWVWRIDVLSQRLGSGGNLTVFACGDSRNKEDTYSLFDKIFVLSAKDDILRERVQSRIDNYFGKNDEELTWIIDQNKTIVEEVSNSGGIVVDANQPLDRVVDDILDRL
jgi:dephospho-CoA kinase